MPDGNALEIVMRQIAEAARAGDFRKVEEGVIVARALGASPRANLAPNLISNEPLHQAPTEREAGGSSETDATGHAFDASRHLRGRAGSSNGVSRRKEARERGKLAKGSFLSTLSANGITVTHMRNCEYRTSKGKRFVIAFATEDSRGDLWWSGSEDRQYDAIVFLCRARDGKLLDFVVPWSFIAPRWTNLSRSGGHVKFHVKRNASGYALDIPHGIGLTITSFLSNLAPLQR